MKKILILLLMLFVSMLPCFADPYKVLRVIDGDTIDIDYKGKHERIRLLNVYTPESVHPDKTRNTRQGKQASDYTKKRLTDTSVSLEFDGKKRGKYGRLLAYVFLDKKNFNLELVQEGWSPYYTKYGASKQYHDQFVIAQNHARIKGVNIWYPPALPIPPYPVTAPGSSLSKSLAKAELFHGNINSHKFHGPDCRYFRCKACTKIFSSRQIALDAGYSPCRLCSP
jgi:micrococcal nuclease